METIPVIKIKHVHNSLQDQNQNVNLYSVGLILSVIAIYRRSNFTEVVQVSI